MPYADPAAKREYQRKWLAERRAEYFADKVCVDCGEVHRLELHHTDPAQKVSSKIWSWSKARREAELAKCVVKCHDCHMGQHYAERMVTEHGTYCMYSHHHCRCELCRAASAKYMRDYRASKKHHYLPN